MDADAELLRRYADEGAQSAFAELARRKVDLVYAAALRQTGGDTDLAQDVTQAVFLALAGRASVLRQHTSLTGWLYTTTRFLAAKAVRTQSRWQRREQQANVMNADASETDPQWDQIRPVIDGAMHELRESEREALLLRFFENRSLAEVGAALGVAENAARMRVDRALDRLRTRLARRGITSTTTALGMVLAGHPAVAAPAAVMQAIAAGVPLAAGALSGAGWLLLSMNTTKLVLGVGLVFAIGAVVGGAVMYSRAPAGATRAEISAVTATAAKVNAIVAAAPPPVPVRAGAPAAPSANATWRALADLKRKKMLELDATFTAANARGELSEPFVEVFQLSGAERQTLQRALDQARERLAELLRENATLTPGTDKEAITLRIEVKPFPQAGGAIYDDVMKAFAQVLGEERNAAFITLAADRLDGAFAHFGAEQRNVTFFYNAQWMNGPYLAAGWVRIGAENTNVSGDFRSRQDIERKLGPIARLLPPDFGRDR